MPANPHYSADAVNAKAAALGALLDGGTLDVYDGAQPDAAADPVTTQTRLVRFRFATPAFGDPAAGVVTAAAIPSALAIATGTAAWYRLTRADDATVVLDDTVGTADAALLLSAVALVLGAPVSITAFTLTEPMAAP